MAVRSSPSFWVFIVLIVLLHFILHVAVGLDTVADLLTVAVLLASRRRTGFGAALIGLGLGILGDALSLTTFGALALVYTVIGFLGARSRDLFEGDSLLFVGVFVFIGKWLRDALYLVLTRTEPWGSLLTSAPLAALFAALAAMVGLVLYRAATGER